ncbi:MAG TPA: MurR/RpiR family transcriptional regulator [Mesorhizobium sp.]|nr:MurR/RpiR family transcriptional regulator [Mesorhizobium sp.]
MDDLAAPALPRDFEAFRALVMEKRHELPRRLAQVAAYALDHPDEVAFGTAASVAAAAGVQPSTLVRLAQHLGFDGFTSLQAVFRERLRGRNASYEERLAALREGDGQSGARRLIEGFAEAAARSLHRMTQRLDEAALERAVGVLAGAETIYLIARRRSFPVASYLAYALGKLEIRNHLIDSTAGLDAEILRFATRRDAALAVSFSPYASGTIENARTLAACGVPVVAVTDSSFSPLAQVATEWFEVAESDFSGFRSLSATMALAMGLAVAVAERRRK